MMANRCTIWVVVRPSADSAAKAETIQADTSSPALSGAEHRAPIDTRIPFPPRLFQILCLALLSVCAWPRSVEAAVTLGAYVAPGGIQSPDFGNVNGLGIGVPTAGLTVITTGVSGGVLYSTPYELIISGLPLGDKATVTVYVNPNFAKSTLLVAESCYPSAGCTNGGAFTPISTNSATPTGIITTAVGNGTYIANLGLFVSNKDGAGVSPGSDAVTPVWVAKDTTTQQTATAPLIAITANLQTAVQFTLATAAGGLTISPASDFAANFGNVNGLGINPPAGLTIVGAAGGVIYSTPYLLQPSFSTFSSTTSSIEVYVSSDFVHPAILHLDDAAVSGGPYNAISKLPGTPTSITTTATNGSNVTRYLGLFVSGANGAGTFTGADNATLTFTMTVP